MKKITLLSLFGVLSLQAQTTYTSENYAGPGDATTLNIGGNFITADFTQTGPDQTWDYTALTSESTTVQTWLDPDDTGYQTTWCFLNLYIFNCSSQWNNAFNLARNITEGYDLSTAGISDVTAHANKSTSELVNKMLGVTATYNAADVMLTVDYTDPDQVYQFPLEFGDDYTDDNSMNVDLTALGIPVAISGTGTRHTQVDGWGSLATPGGTYASVLKVKSTVVTDQTITMEGNDIPIQSTNVIYSWFDPAFTVPVLEVTGTLVADVFVPARVTFPGEVLSTAEIPSLAGVRVFPNPTSGPIHVSGELHVNQVRVFDVLGQQVGDGLDLTALPSGLYLVKVDAAEGSFTRKIYRR